MQFFKYIYIFMINEKICFSLNVDIVRAWRNLLEIREINIHKNVFQVV